MVSEVLPPIDVNITVRFDRLAVRLCRNQDQLLLQKQLDARARPVLRRIHHRNVQRTRRHLISQAIRHVNLDAERNIGRGAAHPVQPFREPRMPETQFTTDRQNRPPSQRHRDLMSRSLPQLHEHWRVAQELLAGWRERRTILVANEQWSAKLLLERPDTGADGRLAHVELFGGPHKTARPDDFHKGPCKLDIHCGHLRKLI